MEGLLELTSALSKGTIPDPLYWGFAPNPKLKSLLSQERVKLRTSNLVRAITGSIRTMKSLFGIRILSVSVIQCTNFYRAMHNSAKRGLAIACRP